MALINPEKGSRGLELSRSYHAPNIYFNASTLTNDITAPHLRRLLLPANAAAIAAHQEIPCRRAARRVLAWEEKMRGTDFYQKQIDGISTIAQSQETDWQTSVEFLVRRFHSESMPLTRTTFRQLKEDICRELDGIAQLRPLGSRKEVYSFAATLIRKL